MIGAETVAHTAGIVVEIIAEIAVVMAEIVAVIIAGIVEIIAEIVVAMDVTEGIINMSPWIIAEIEASPVTAADTRTDTIIVPLTDMKVVHKTHLNTHNCFIVQFIERQQFQ